MGAGWSEAGLVLQLGEPESAASSLASLSSSTVRPRMGSCRVWPGLVPADPGNPL